MRRYIVVDHGSWTRREMFFDICNWIVEIDKEMNGEVMKRKVMPYGFVMTISDIMKNARDYDMCTKSSKEILFEELIGLIPIVNRMIDIFEEDDVTILLTEGKHKGETRTVKKTIAHDFLECGFAKLV